MRFFEGKRVLVTGGSGFIASHVVEQLLELGATVRACDRSAARFEEVLGAAASRVEFLEGDLNQPEFALGACRGQNVVLHLAARVAGVGYNVGHPATLLRENVPMGLHVLDACARCGVERVLLTSSACVYRRHCAIPTPESEGFVDDPEPTNLGYGWGKRFLEVEGRCYAQEFGLQVAIARPYNAYGPRDNFEWETSHVIPGLIRKCLEGHDPVKVWGDGSQTRSFLYVTDFAAGLLVCAAHCADCEPVNIGSDEEICVRDLVKAIARLSGCRSRIEFDASAPAGQPRRIGDYSRARRAGFEPRVRLEEGLARTIEWYRAARGR